MTFISLQETNRITIPFCETLLQEVWKKSVYYYSIYGEEDYRYSFFATYSATLLWALVQLENFSNHNPDSIIKNRFDTLKKSSLAQLLLQYDTINRQSFVVVTMALVEDFINSVCQEVFSKTYPNYSQNIKKLCDKIFPENQYKFHVLYSLYLIRNSLHNNGYIKILNQGFDLQIGAKKYVFQKGQQITFSGWNNLLIITKELLNIIIQIIENKDIKLIKKIEHTKIIC